MEQSALFSIDTPPKKWIKSSGTRISLSLPPTLFYHFPRPNDLPQYGQRLTRVPLSRSSTRRFYCVGPLARPRQRTPTAMTVTKAHDTWLSRERKMLDKH